MEHPLRIVHAPLHGVTANTRQIQRALSLFPCSIAFSEAYPLNIYPFIVTRLRYPATVGRKNLFIRLRGAHDTPILRRRHHEEVDSFAYKACDSSEPIKIAPARWNTGVAYKHPYGLIAHITAHPNAAVEGRDPAKVDRVAKYVEQMTKLEASIRTWRAKGYTVVVTGDLNHHAGGPQWAPEAMFERLGFRTWQQGLEWVGWDRRLRLPARNRTLITDNGQDHPWMVAEFVLREG